MDARDKRGHDVSGLEVAVQGSQPTQPTADVESGISDKSRVKRADNRFTDVEFFENRAFK